MAILQIPQEPDEGLFYIRVWWADAEKPLETQYTSLREATDRADAIYRTGGYSRFEFLQAREWGTRQRLKTAQ